MSQSKRISLYLLVLVAGFAVTAGVWPNDKQALALTQDYARPLFVVLIATLGWVLAKRLYPRATRWVGEVRDVGVKRLWPLVFVLLATVLSCTREPHNFKVTADEYVLSSQALNMHISGWSQVPSRMHEINGVFRSTSGTIDKRPPLFVVLLSLVHDVTGYRVNNVFALNTVLTFLLLLLTFASCDKFFGRGAAYFGTALLATFPLLWQNASGAGFEILNMVLILGFLLAGRQYVAEGTRDAQRLFVLIALLLANTRYESSVFALGAGLVILHQWWVRRTVTVDWMLYAAPLVMTTFLWRMRVFDYDRTTNWQLAPGASPFELKYLNENIGHALNYFLSFSKASTTSEIVFILGFPGLIFLVWVLVKQSWRAKAEPHMPALFVATLLVAGNFGLLMLYHWGHLDSPEVSRLALPFALLMVFGACFLIFRVIARVYVTKIAWIALAVFAAMLALPRGAMAAPSLGNFHVRRADWTIKVIESLPPRRYLVGTFDTHRLFLEKVPALPIMMLNIRRQEMSFGFDEKIFGILVVQRHFMDPVTKQSMLFPEDELHPMYRTELVAENSFRPYVYATISRVTSIDASKVSEPFKPSQKVEDNYRGEAIRTVSFEEITDWLKMLP